MLSGKRLPGRITSVSRVQGDLSPIQFFIGFLGCLQEEKSNTIYANMIDYGRHLMQDALEINWSTTRHAHLVVLQDIEHGKLSWKTQINTARVIMPKNTN